MAKADQIRLLTRVGDEWALTLAQKEPEGWSVVQCTTFLGSADQIAPDLLAAWKALGNAKTVVLNAGLSLLVKEIAVPVVAVDQQEEALVHEVEQAVPFSLDGALWDAVRLDDDTIEQRHLLMATRDDQLEASILPLREASGRAGPRPPRASSGRWTVSTKT